MQSLDQVQDLQDQLQQARQVISHLASQVDHYQDLHKQLAGEGRPRSAPAWPCSAVCTGTRPFLLNISSSRFACLAVSSLTASHEQTAIISSKIYLCLSVESLSLPLDLPPIVFITLNLALQAS